MKKIILTCVILLLVAMTAVSAVLAHAPASSERADAESETVYIDSEEAFLRYVMNGVLDDSKNYVLTTDIYLDRYYLDRDVRSEGFDFNGALDGRGHAIIGLKEALFGTLFESAVVKNLNLIGVDIVANQNAAPLAMVNFGTITNVSVTGNVSGYNASGIVVSNFGTISDCSVVADITATGLSGLIAVTNSTKDGVGSKYETIERCSDLYTRGLLGKNGLTNKATVSYDDCNPFGMIAGDFGEITDLTKHSTQTASADVITAFNTLGELFGAFMENFEVPTNGTEYLPAVSGDALTDYTAFYNKAIDIYNNSFVTWTQNVSGDLTMSAVIGVNHPYTMAFGAEGDLVNPTSINYQLAIANMFGFGDKSAFMEYAQMLADTYAEHKSNIANSLPRNEALDNGCFYTNNGSFIFPIAVKNTLSSTALAYVIIDADGLVSVWVNDVTAVLKATNFNDLFHTGTVVVNELYCKNVLFVTGINKVLPSNSLIITNNYGRAVDGTIAQVNASYADGLITAGVGDFVGETIDNYVELEYYLLTYAGTKKSLGASINLYNTPLLEDNNLNLQEELETAGTYLNRTGYLFYNSLKISSATFTPQASMNTVPSASTSLSGSGTKAEPYKISSAADFLALGTLESGYAMLTNPITLGLTAYDYYVDALKVNFDGNGYSIDGVSKPLFNSISEGVTVNAITIIGSSANYVALTNNGTISAVNVIGDGGYGVKNNAENGLITRASIDITSGGVAETSLGMVELTRNLGGGDFFATESTGQVRNSYQIGDWNATNLTKSVNYASGTYTVSDGTLSELVDTNAYVTIETTNAGWAFAQSLSWGFIKDESEDVPVLVFPEDKLDYKLITRIKNPYANIAESFGVNNGSISREMRTLLDYTLDANPEAYGVLDAENNLYYDFDAFYQVVPSAITPFSRKTVESAIKQSFSREVRAKLDQEATFNWSYRKADGSYQSIGTQDELSQVDDTLTEYKFNFALSYAYAKGTFTVYDTYAVLTIDYTTGAYGMVDLIYKLGLNNLQNTLTDLGYTQTDIINPLGFEGVTVTITDDFGNVIGVNELIYNVGKYTVTIDIAPRLNTTGYSFTSMFVLTKGNLDLSGYEITSFIGGLTQATALTYNPNEIVNVTNNFRLHNYDYDHYSILVEIVYLTRTDYTVIYPTQIQDAGSYKLSLTIRVPGYNDCIKEVYFYVKRQVVTVSTAVTESVIEFYDEHPQVIYLSTLGSQAWLTDNLSYTSDYYVGADANAEYTVSLYVPNPDRIHNYEVQAGSSATFKVVPASIDLDNVGFNSKTVTYNGELHSIIVDKTKVEVKPFDVTPYEYTVTYKYEGETSLEPFSFKNAGKYILSAIVTPNTANYKEAETSLVTLQIKGLNLTLTAKDTNVNFGDDPVYELTIRPTNQEEDVGEDYLANIGLGEVIYMTSSYVKGDTKGGSVLVDDIVFKRVDEKNILGSAVGNYIISATENGTLTVGKRYYTLDMVNSYPYTGKAVILDFNGEKFSYSASYKRHNILEDTYTDLGTDVPISACAPNYEYVAVIDVAETDEYYGITAREIAFTITPIDVNISGLYVTNGTTKALLTEDMEFPYNGKDYVINIDQNELPYGVSFVWEFSYKLFDGTEVVGSNAINLKDVTKIKDVRLTLTTTAGNYNYNGYDSSESLSVTRFEITPKEIKYTVPSNLVYQGEAFSNEQIESAIGALDYAVGYEVVEGDDFDYSVSFDEMKLPGNYAVSVASNSGNYMVKDVVYFTVTHATATINFDDIGILEFYYGEIKKIGSERYPKFTRETSYTLGSYNGIDDIQFRVDCAEHQIFLVPDDALYDVISVDPLYKDGVKCVEFSLTGGNDKIRVKPLEVTFDWAQVRSSNEGFKLEYVYSGAPISYYGSFDVSMVESTIAGISVVTDPAIRITLNGNNPFKHVGEYTFTADSRYKALNDNYQEVSCFIVDDSVKSFTTQIVAKTVVYEVNPITIYIGDDFPTGFNLTYPIADNVPFASDILSYTYSATDFSSAVPQTFGISVNVLVVDGGISYADYNYVKRDPNAKELIVSYLNFEDDIIVENYSAIYTGTAINVPVTNLPQGATVSYSQSPINVGEYDVTVTIHKQGHIDKSFDVKLTITKATPYVTTGKHDEVAYSGGYVLSALDITAQATFNGAVVDGVFSFTVTEPEQTLVFGEHTYKIDFTPTDTVNFNSVKNVSYKLTSSVSEQAITVTTGAAEIAEVINGIEQAVIAINAPEELTSKLVLYVNGEEVVSPYAFTESAENVVVEIKIDGNVVYSKMVNVVIGIEETPEDPSGGGSSGNKPSTGNKPSGNSGGKPNVSVNMDEKTKNTLIIVGASVGGVAVVVGIVVAIIFILKKKGGIGKDEK